MLARSIAPPIPHPSPFTGLADMARREILHWITRTTPLCHMQGATKRLLEKMAGMFSQEILVADQLFAQEIALQLINMEIDISPSARPGDVLELARFIEPLSSTSREEDLRRGMKICVAIHQASIHEDGRPSRHDRFPTDPGSVVIKY